VISVVKSVFTQVFGAWEADGYCGKKWTVDAAGAEGKRKKTSMFQTRSDEPKRGWNRFCATMREGRPSLMAQQLQKSGEEVSLAQNRKRLRSACKKNASRYCRARCKSRA